MMLMTSRLQPIDASGGRGTARNSAWQWAGGNSCLHVLQNPKIKLGHTLQNQEIRLESYGAVVTC